ncbi:DUF1104 domain-containing protein [Helicobacter sp. 23-1045]
MKVLSSILAVTIASGALFAADFSKSSNADLLNLAGKIKAEEAKDYFAEIEKRVDEMTGKEAREFREKFHANEQKVFDNMKMKDIRAYKQSLAGARGGKACGGFGNPPFDKGSKGAKGTKGAKSAKGEYNKGKGQGRGNCGANCNPPAPPAK